jgi:Tfp pilus assembly protein PilW
VIRRRLHPIRDESGVTLIELVVATSAGLVLFMGLTMMVLASMHQTTRISNRVHATQDARTAVHRVVNELQSACAARYLTPVKEGSTGTNLKFARAYGSAVSPSPVMSEVKLEGTDLFDWEYPVSGGSTPEWSFNTTTPTSKRALIKNAGQVSSSIPIFSYYEIASGTPTAVTPGSSGLTEKQADKVVKVDIALKVTPSAETVSDPNAAATVQDGAYLRFSSPTYVTSSVNGPCE